MTSETEAAERPSAKCGCSIRGSFANTNLRGWAGEDSSLRPRQPTTQHDATHRLVDHRLRRRWQTLVVFAEPPRQTQPRERPFHHPSPRQDLEPPWLLLQPVALKLAVSVMGYLDPPSSLLFGPLAKTARVRSVGPNQLHPGQLTLQVLGQQPPPAVLVWEVRSVDPSG